MEIILSNYTDKDLSNNHPEYNLRLNFEPLSYFNLINSFQFSTPIYILLFSLVSLVLLFGIIIFWIANLITLSNYKKPPSVRFYHMASVTFWPPLFGTTLASIPVMIVAGFLKFMQNSTAFEDVRSSWSEYGNTGITQQAL